MLALGVVGVASTCINYACLGDGGRGDIDVDHKFAQSILSAAFRIRVKSEVMPRCCLGQACRRKRDALAIRVWGWAWGLTSSPRDVSVLSKKNSGHGAAVIRKWAEAL
jgi:hypothetical protein